MASADRGRIPFNVVNVSVYYSSSLSHFYQDKRETQGLRTKIRAVARSSSPGPVVYGVFCLSFFFDTSAPVWFLSNPAPRVTGYYQFKPVFLWPSKYMTFVVKSRHALHVQVGRNLYHSISAPSRRPCCVAGTRPLGCLPSWFCFYNQCYLLLSSSSSPSWSLSAAPSPSPSRPPISLAVKYLSSGLTACWPIQSTIWNC